MESATTTVMLNLSDNGAGQLQRPSSRPSYLYLGNSYILYAILEVSTEAGQCIGSVQLPSLLRYQRSITIVHQFDAEVSDRWLIDVDPMDFTIWVSMGGLAVNL